VDTIRRIGVGAFGCFFFFQQQPAYEFRLNLVGAEMGIRDSRRYRRAGLHRHRRYHQAGLHRHRRYRRVGLHRHRRYRRAGLRRVCRCRRGGAHRDRRHGAVGCGWRPR
ncbi:hypothetical protein, partial [Salmonella enterica]|uniref:hypothetical protein n=1 Tax=Salmonella enterica TaxID=28901 RepID=UPI00223603C8